VLGRPRLRKKFPVLSDELVERFLTAIEERAVLVPEVPRVFVYERDPKDEPYINLAIKAGPNYLVSRDTDVLDLAKLSNPDGERLQRHAPHLQILEPVSFLAEARRRLAV
jgi:predicted nucleic acid-binding protein